MRRPLLRHGQVVRATALAAAATLVIAMLAATAAQASPARTKASSRTAPLTTRSTPAVPPSLERAIQKTLGTHDPRASGGMGSPQQLEGSWSQTAELQASDGTPGDNFGVSVALSADGTTALVGAYGRDSYTGVAYVFAQSGGAWTQTAELQASDGAPNDYFGVSVALSSDGTTALVGAHGHSSRTGAAYVFAQSGGSWAQTAELKASDGARHDDFGVSVALSSDGTTALVGAYGRKSAAGAAYVFTHSGGAWTQTAELQASDGAPNDYFGVSVALSSDGAVALVGALYHNSLAGAAYVFGQSRGSWSQTAELKASDGAAYDWFGSSVALSSDGTTALVGAVFHSSSTGAAYFFAQSGGSWSQAAELQASDGAQNDEFGNSVALSGDGTVALVGAPGHGSATGAAYVFAQGGGSWSQATELQASDGAQNDEFGISVALSSAGTTALAGAVGHNSYSGATYVFTKGAAQAAALKFNPAAGPPTSFTKLVGWGFAPGETVNISFLNRPREATVTANSKGRFVLGVNVPGGAKSGQKVRAIAKGETSGLIAKATFTVT